MNKINKSSDSKNNLKFLLLIRSIAPIYTHTTVRTAEI